MTERDVVRQCIVALRDGHFLDDNDLQTRVGLHPHRYDALRAQWPDIDDGADDSDACVLVNNALNEVCHEVFFTDAEWARWFTVPRERVIAVYRRWAYARGWTRRGIH